MFSFCSFFFLFFFLVLVSVTTFFWFFSCLLCLVLFTHCSSCKLPMVESDQDQRRDLRLEATVLFVRQQLSANLGPAASRQRGNLFGQQLAHERYKNDMTFRVLNNLSGQQRADFIHFAESKLLEPPCETRILAPVIPSGPHLRQQQLLPRQQMLHPRQIPKIQHIPHRSESSRHHQKDRLHLRPPTSPVECRRVQPSGSCSRPTTTHGRRSQSRSKSGPGSHHGRRPRPCGGLRFTAVPFAVKRLCALSCFGLVLCCCM